MTNVARMYYRANLITTPLLVLLFLTRKLAMLGLHRQEAVCYSAVSWTEECGQRWSRWLQWLPGGVGTIPIAGSLVMETFYDVYDSLIDMEV
jgi:hypothetical protein